MAILLNDSFISGVIANERSQFSPGDPLHQWSHCAAGMYIRVNIGRAGASKMMLFVLSRFHLDQHTANFKSGRYWSSCGLIIINVMQYTELLNKKTQVGMSHSSQHML